MNKVLACLLAFLAVEVTSLVHGAVRASANYALTAETVDAGGEKTTSADYSNSGGLGHAGGVSTASGSVEVVARPGFFGQYYELRGLAIAAHPDVVDEGAGAALRATAVLDDDTTLRLVSSEVAWSAVSGPIDSISAAGQLTAATVFEDTAATVQGTYRGFLDTTDLLVRDVKPDNYGLYAEDGLPDRWQIEHFGPDNPDAALTADPDGDGQDNQLEFLAGVNPADSSSVLRFRIENVPGEPTHKRIIFSPRLVDRTYTLQSRDELAQGNFAPLADLRVSDTALERTITDLDAASPTRFYRLQIMRP